MVITNYPEGETEWLEAENNPEDENAGYRQIPFSRELYIEQEDFKEEGLVGQVHVGADRTRKDPIAPNHPTGLCLPN